MNGTFAKSAIAIALVSALSASAADTPGKPATRGDVRKASEGTFLDDHLDRKLPEVNFNGNNLVDVIDFLRDVTGANIFVN